MGKDFTCKCGEVLIKSLYREDYFKLKGKVLLSKGGKLFSICKKCDSEVELPVTTSVDLVLPKIFVRK